MALALRVSLAACLVVSPRCSEPTLRRHAKGCKHDMHLVGISLPPYWYRVWSSGLRFFFFFFR